MVIYQMYPLGLCGALHIEQSHHLQHIEDWLDHIQKAGFDTILLNPIFQSDFHGYDIQDYTKIDRRLGNEQDMIHLAKQIHQRGMKLLFDGVFHHVGIGHPFFQDVILNRYQSQYHPYFYTNFSQDQPPYGFWYADWEGHRELVKLRLDHPEVFQYLFSSVKQWIEKYDIDGLRIDVAYCIDPTFLTHLKAEILQIKQDFLMIGEMVSGDYNSLFQRSNMDIVTNYECRKGIYSSFNSQNFFEIAHSLHRQFSDEPWSLYRGKHLLSFVDNHDVDRIASMVDQRDLINVYTLMYTIPGVPCIYYGSEWGIQGKKTATSDEALRPTLRYPVWNALTDHIAFLNHLYQAHPVFYDGSYRNIQIQNTTLLFERKNTQETILCAFNMNDYDVELTLPQEFNGIDLVQQKSIQTSQLSIKAKSFRLLQWF